MKQHALDPNSTFWHLIFAQGTREEIAAGPESDRRVVVQEITSEYCAALVRSYGEWMTASASAGALPQPRPVSTEHIIVSVAMGEEDDAEKAYRDGDVLALHHMTEPTDNMPAGVYALIRWADHWTPDDRRRLFLSPSTVASYRMRSGQRIAGPFLYEIGRVALPALDTIGDMTERLGWATFPLPAWVAQPSTDAAGPVVRAATLTLPTAAAIIRRGALYQEPAAMELTAETVAEMIAKAIAEAMTEMRGYMESRAIATPSAPVEPPAANGDGEPGEDVTMRAIRVATGLARTEAIDLVERRQLAPGSVAEFVRRRVNGEAPNDLLQDYSQLTVRSGVTGSPVNESAPVVAKPTQIKESEIVARASKALEDAGKTVSPAALTAAIHTATTAATADGLTILRGV